MFIGVSKTSRHRDMISRRITKYLTDKNNIKSVERNLQALITDFEQRYSGVVPPTFIKEKNNAESAVSTAQPVGSNN